MHWHLGTFYMAISHWLLLLRCWSPVGQCIAVSWSSFGWPSAGVFSLNFCCCFVAVLLTRLVTIRMMMSIKYCVWQACFSGCCTTWQLRVSKLVRGLIWVWNENKQSIATQISRTVHCSYTYSEDYKRLKVIGRMIGHRPNLIGQWSNMISHCSISYIDQKKKKEKKGAPSDLFSIYMIQHSATADLGDVPACSVGILAYKVMLARTCKYVTSIRRRCRSSLPVWAQSRWLVGSLIRVINVAER